MQKKNIFLGAIQPAKIVIIFYNHNNNFIHITDNYTLFINTREARIKNTYKLRFIIIVLSEWRISA